MFRSEVHIALNGRRGKIGYLKSLIVDNNDSAAAYNFSISDKLYCDFWIRCIKLGASIVDIKELHSI